MDQSAIIRRTQKRQSKKSVGESSKIEETLLSWRENENDHSKEKKVSGFLHQAMEGPA